MSDRQWNHQIKVEASRVIKLSITCLFTVVIFEMNIKLEIFNRIILVLTYCYQSQHQIAAFFSMSDAIAHTSPDFADDKDD